MSIFSEAPRKTLKRETILAIAKNAFLTDGYADTSMSSIAARLGGSKGTLYNYFASKEELFSAVMRDHCSTVGHLMDHLTVGDGGFEARLRRFGEGYLTLILTDEFLAIYRLVTAEAARFPEITAAFFEAGPNARKAELAQFFAQAMERGELRRADPQLAARQFFDLCRSDLHRLRLWAAIPPPTPAQISQAVSEASDAIMRLYAPD